MTTPPSPHQDRPGELPSSIVAAVKLMYVGAGLSALGIVFSLTTRDTIRDRIAEDDPGLAADELTGRATMATGQGVVIGLIAIGLWLWMARANQHGLDWARIVATVLGVLNVVFTLFNLSQTTGFGVVLNVVSIGLAGAILWLLYRSDSSSYYAARSSPAR